MPATNRVVHIDPGPIPTLITSTPSLLKNFDQQVLSQNKEAFDELAEKIIL